MASDKRPSRKRPPDLPAPTMIERARAAEAARALRRAIADPSTMGAASTGHIDMSRPRRAVWFATWANLPGFTRYIDGSGRHYTHESLPGWEYARHEIVSEMILDLELLAERGVRPTEVTGRAA